MNSVSTNELDIKYSFWKKIYKENDPTNIIVNKSACLCCYKLGDEKMDIIRFFYMFLHNLETIKDFPVNMLLSKQVKHTIYMYINMV